MECISVLFMDVQGILALVAKCGPPHRQDQMVKNEIYRFRFIGHKMDQPWESQPWESIGGTKQCDLT